MKKQRLRVAQEFTAAQAESRCIRAERQYREKTKEWWFRIRNHTIVLSCQACRYYERHVMNLLQECHLRSRDIEGEGDMS